jgi:hypothetical protein
MVWPLFPNQEKGNAKVTVISVIDESTRETAGLRSSHSASSSNSKSAMVSMRACSINTASVVPQGKETHKFLVRSRLWWVKIEAVLRPAITFTQRRFG